jgi:branched-chain amino acid transport system ATP-binding protein
LTHLFGRLSVQDNLRCGAFGALGYRACWWRNGATLPAVEARVAATLDEIGLAARRDVPAAMLTYAEQRALEIGIAIVGGAGVILLDEPTSGMSRAEADHAVALIRRISEGRSLVIVEHDMSVVFGLADRVSVLVYGEVLATDTPQRVRDNAAVRRAYLGDLAVA